MILVDSLSLRQGDFTLDGISFEVARGEYAVLMGRTGAGKTSLLEAVCGLRRTTAGRILLDGEDVTHARPGERGVGYVPQDGVLFPTMTVEEHLSLGPRLHRWSAPDTKARVAELGALLGIAHLARRRPRGLSGGEGRRVALGRALAARPRVLCLDEPLVGLDEDTRGEMVEVLRAVHACDAVTVLHVTHSRTEAVQLAGKVLVIEDGRIRHASPVSPPIEERPPR